MKKVQLLFFSIGLLFSFSSYAQNNALDFDGNNDGIYASGPFNNVSPSVFSFEFWINPSYFQNYNQMLGAANGWGAFNIHATSNGAMYVGTDIATRLTETEIPSGTMVLNTWQHFAFTYDNGIGKLYKNGVLLATKYNMTAPNVWGGFSTQSYGTYAPQCKLDEVRIWSICLSANDIANNMNKKPASTVTGLVAYYDFDQGTAGGSNSGQTTIIDKSANGYNASVNNFALSGSTSNFVASGVTFSGTYALNNPTITGVASNQTACLGNPAYLYMPTDGPNRTFNWYKDDVLINGQNKNVLTITSVAASSAGVYKLVVSSSGVSLTSPGITLNTVTACNNALSFNTNNYLSNSTIFTTPPTQFSIEFWLYPKSGANYNQLLGSNYGWDAFLFHTDNNLGIFVGTDLNTRIGDEIPSNTLELNKWQHYAFTFNNGTGKLYKNGVLLATKSGMSMPVGWNGFQTSSGSWSIDGSLDEFRIWNTCLSSADIAANMYTKPIGNESGLIAYYSFDQGTGNGFNQNISKALDKTSNNNHSNLNLFALDGSSSNFVVSSITFSGTYAFSTVSITGTASTQIACIGETNYLYMPYEGANATVQWYKNNVPISGQTTSVLTLTGISAGSAGNYFTVVSQGAATFTSPGITLLTTTVCNNALNFSTNNYLSNNTIFTSAPTQFSVEFWLNPKSGANYNQLLGSNYGWDAFLFHTDNNKGIFVGTDLNNRIGSELPNNTLELNKWQHYAFTFSNGTGKLYKDGILLVSKAGMAMPVAWNGFKTSSGTWSLDGTLDELRIWNICLPGSDIANNLYNQPTGNETGLLAYYNFSDGIAAGYNGKVKTIKDRTNKNNNLTANNFAFNGGTNSNFIAEGITLTGIYSFDVPTIVGINDNTAVCSGNTATLSVTANGSNLSYQWYKNNFVSSISGQNTSTLSISNFTISEDGIYYAFVTNPSGSVTSSGISLIVGNTWTGNTSNSWNTSSNWACGSVPSASTSVVLPSNLTNLPVISSNSQIASLIINTGSSLSISGTGSLAVLGNFINNGTFNAHQTSLVSFAGTNFQTIGGVNTSTFGNLSVANSIGVINNQDISIQNALTLGSGAKFTTTGYNFTLISNSATGITGRIALIPSNATFVGDKITMQRYVPGKKTNRYISSPFTNSTALQLQQKMVVSGYFDGNSNGFDATQYLYYGNVPTVKYYVETVAGSLNLGFTDIRTITSAFEVGRGYQIFVRGDRNDPNSNATSATTVASQASDVIISLQGAINQGDINVPISYTNSGVATNDGWNLIGNPYPSEITFEGFPLSGNLANAIYLLDPGTKNTTVTAVSGKYITYIPDAGCVPNISNCGNIASMQGFFVKASAATNLIFTESMKVATSANLFRTAQTPNRLAIDLNPEKAALGLNDQTVIAFGDKASFRYECNQDALKLLNGTGANISTKSAEGFDLVYNKLALDSALSIEIPLIIKTNDSLRTLVFSGVAGFETGIKLQLLDRKTNTYTDIEEGTKYLVSTSKKDTASTSPNRLRILARKESTNTSPELTGTMSSTEIAPFVVHPNPNTGSFKVKSKAESPYQIYALEGNLVKEGHLQIGENTIETYLKSGFYLFKSQNYIFKLLVE